MPRNTLYLGLVLALVALFALGRKTYEELIEDDAMTATESANLFAFLKLIRQAESNDDYFALVGGGQFSDTSDHPAITGEWPGIRREDDGRLTTAAGGYQITRTTWNDIRRSIELYDFLPASQDAAAIQLLKRRGAYDHVIAGRFDSAIAKLRNEWEAFARMIAGDYPITLADAQAIYESAGGSVA